MEFLSASNEPNARRSAAGIGYGGIVMNRVRGLLLHAGVICSFVCLVAKILDWYNPYMDFSGHVIFMQLALYFAVILLAFMRKVR